MEVWVLTIYVLYGPPFMAGQYQSEEICRTQAAMQWPYWWSQYGKRLKTFTCTRERP